jgi:Domain of unknown function (DUF4160)
MATLKTFSIPGLKLWFYSNDHEPPHFHAKRKGEWEVRVKFLEPDETMFEIKWRKAKKTVVSAQDKKTLKEMVEKHRFEILKEWQEVQPS